MMSRCYNQNDKCFYRYGGRGVYVCIEWKGNYQAFLNWSLANGWEKGLQLDKDIKGNGLLYSPATCIWVTHEVNSYYKRNSVRFDYHGSSVCLSEICKRKGLKITTIHTRVKNGMSYVEAIDTPIQNKNDNLILGSNKYNIGLGGRKKKQQ